MWTLIYKHAMHRLTYAPYYDLPFPKLLTQLSSPTPSTSPHSLLLMATFIGPSSTPAPLVTRTLPSRPSRERHALQPWPTSESHAINGFMNHDTPQLVKLISLTMFQRPLSWSVHQIQHLQLRPTPLVSTQHRLCHGMAPNLRPEATSSSPISS